VARGGSRRFSFKGGGHGSRAAWKSRSFSFLCADGTNVHTVETETLSARMILLLSGRSRKGFYL
jgi:hypothetical protein